MKARHCSFAMLLLLTCGTPSVLAQVVTPNWCDQPTPHPADAAFEAALERSGGVTADMRDAQGIAFSAWDAELNRLYRALLTKSGKSQADALRGAQRAWLAWDTSESKSDLAFAADKGTSGPVAVSSLAIERRRARACTLRQAVEEEN